MISGEVEIDQSLTAPEILPKTTHLSLRFFCPVGKYVCFKSTE